MDIIAICLGTVFCLMGVLSKKFPERLRLSGIHARRMNDSDQHRAGILYGKGLFLTGFAIVAVYFILRLCGMQKAAEIALIAIGLGGIFVTTIAVYRHMPASISKYITILLSVLVIAATAFGLWYGSKETEITVHNNKLSITGPYGTEIEIPEVEHAEVTRHLPPIKSRTNGFSMSGTRKGWFTLEEYGRTRLFIDDSKKGPYIVIRITAGEHTVFNTRDEGQARELITSITEKQ